LPSGNPAIISGLHVEHELAAEHAADVFAHHADLRVGKPLARRLYVAGAEGLGLAAERVEHGRPSEHLGPQARPDGTQLEQALDQEGHRGVAEAGGCGETGRQQEMVDSADAFGLVPEADRDTGAEDRGHLDATLRGQEAAGGQVDVAGVAGRSTARHVRQGAPGGHAGRGQAHRPGARAANLACSEVQ
jgi:hypothetical protein